MIERPTARYGRQRASRRTRRWAVIGLTVLIVIAGVAIAYLGYHRLGSGAADGTLAGYRVLDGETVQITMTVTRSDPSRPVVCIVRARAIDGSETGRREVLVPPSAQATLQVTTTVKSSRPPVLAEVYGCGTNVPPYLVAS
jgi:hypothetical protein